MDTEDHMLMGSYFEHVPRFDSRGGQVVFQQRSGFTIFDTDEWRRQIIVKFKGNPGVEERLTISPDGRRISVVLSDFDGGQSAAVYDADTGKHLRAFAAGADQCRLFNESRWAVCEFWKPRERPAEIRDVGTDKVLQTILGSLEEVSPDDSTVLFRTPEGRTSVWRVRRRGGEVP